MVFVGYRCPRQVMVCVLPTKPGSHRLADRDFISKERQDEIKRSLSKDYRWHFPPRIKPASASFGSGLRTRSILGAA